MRLTSGSPRGGVRETLRVAGPLAFAMVAGGAVNHVCDRLFLAHCSDSAALAASLPALMVATMFIGFLSAAIGYSGTFVAQFHGDGRYREAVGSFAQGLWLALFAAPLFLALVPVCTGVVALAGHTPEMQAAERAYLVVFVPGGIFTVLTAVLGGVITGQGRTRLVSAATVAGCLVNLALDPLLIFGWGPVPALGIAGAAGASVGAQAVTSGILAVAVARDGLIRSARGKGWFKPDAARLRELLRFGVPAGISSFTACVAFTTFTLVIGRLDGLVCAASNTVFAVNNIFYLFLCATSEGVRILTGRFHGAGDDDAARRTFRSGLKLAFLAMAVCFAVVLPCAGLIMDLFHGDNPDFDAELYRRTGQALFLIMFIREFAETVLSVSVGALRGVGDTKYVMIVQTAADFILWIPSVLLVAHFIPDIRALWATMPVNLAIIATALAVRWARGSWRRIRF